MNEARLESVVDLKEHFEEKLEAATEKWKEKGGF